MSKPFLILQLRPETEASDNEYEAILDKAGLTPGRTRRIRLDAEDLPADLDLSEYAGTIVGGGPGCVSDPPDIKSPLDARCEAAAMSLMPEVLANDRPFLGCCYGIGILGTALGGSVTKERYSEKVGPSACWLTAAGKEDPLTANLAPEFTSLVGHKEALQALPEGCTHLVASEACPFQMFRFKSNVYATQFHPEADAGVFETRIRVYDGYGYFDRSETQAIIASFATADISEPPKILANFVARYG